MVEVPLFPIEPSPVNSAKHPAVARSGAVGPERTRLPHPIGACAKNPSSPLFMVIAPTFVSALPSNSVSAANAIAAAETIFPFIVFPEAMLTVPSIIQNTLHA